jgi:hypothetical protein
MANRYKPAQLAEPPRTISGVRPLSALTLTTVEPHHSQAESGDGCRLTPGRVITACISDRRATMRLIIGRLPSHGFGIRRVLLIIAHPLSA